jgi:hypothetical protein
MCGTDEFHRHCSIDRVGQRAEGVGFSRQERFLRGDVAKRVVDDVFFSVIV